MQTPRIPKNELARLDTLKNYYIMDSTPEEEFDNLTKLASEVCGTPISLITFLDETRQWFKSATGLTAKETSKEISFCGHAILGDELFEVQDTLDDERFKDNPLVTQDPKIRFYAGMPISAMDGSNLGTLCVIDKIPRKLEPHQRKSLYRIGKQVIALLEHRKALFEIDRLKNKLEESSTFYNVLLNSTDESIISTTLDGLITSFNQGAEKMLGYKAEEVVGKVTPAILHDPDEVKAYAEELSMAYGKSIQPGFEVLVLKAREGKVNSRRWTYFREDGTKLIVTLSITAIRDYHGEVTGYLGVARDNTTLVETERSLSNLNSIMERTGQMAKVGGWEINLLNNELKWTKEVFNIHEIESSTPPPLEDAIGFYPLEVRPTIAAAFKRAIEEGLAWDMELPFITANGNHIWVRSQGVPILAHGKACSLTGAFQDITQRKLAEEQIRQLAFYDPLTALPNRRLLLDRLEKALASSVRSKKFGALMFIDLDNFKTLNDTLGHEKGDMLLQEVAKRLKRCLRDEDTLARFGGDEFVIMIENLDNDIEQATSFAHKIGNKILNELNHTFDFDRYQHLSTPSIGIALFNNHTKSVSELIKQADTAMYKSKAAGRNRLSFFSEVNLQ